MSTDLRGAECVVGPACQEGDRSTSPVDRNDTSLTSPTVDLAGQSKPVIGFDTYYYDYGFGTQDGYVDLSLDGGATWGTVWRAPDAFVQGHVEVPVPQAANAKDVRVRFRFSGENDNYWELDNVYVGTRSCEATPGGLVAGFVRDHNTGAALSGVQISGGTPAVSQATPEDAQLGDGYYWLFSNHAGRVALTASGRRYASAAATAAVAEHRTARQDWSLRAGQVTVTPHSISVSTGGRPVDSRTVTFTNHGTEPAKVTFVEQDRGFTSAGVQRRTASPGAPLRREKVDAAPLSFAQQHGKGHEPAPSRDVSENPAWSALPNYPTPIMDNVVAANDGIVYSVAGATDNGLTGAGYAYDATAKSWRRIADLPEPRENAVGGFVGGKLYVAGGWDVQGNLTSTTYVYDPAANRWSRVADLPSPSSAAAGAVAGGKLYVVAGCETVACAETAPTYRYDSGHDAWTRLAEYPEHVVMQGCTGSADSVICAGGLVPSDDPWHEFPVAERLSVCRRLGHLDPDRRPALSRLGNGVLGQWRQAAARRRHHQRFDHQPGRRIRPRERCVVGAAQRDVHHVPRRCSLWAEPDRRFDRFLHRIAVRRAVARPGCLRDRLRRGMAFDRPYAAHGAARRVGDSTRAIRSRCHLDGRCLCRPLRVRDRYAVRRDTGGGHADPQVTSTALPKGLRTTASTTV